MAKILMVGVLDVESSTNVSMKRAFESLGHEVTEYNYRTVLKKCNGNILEMNGFFVDYIRKAPKGVFDLVVFCKTDTLLPNSIKVTSKRFKTFYFFMDPIQTAKNFDSLGLVKYSHFASATSSEVVSYFKQVNDNVYQIIEGVNLKKNI